MCAERVAGDAARLYLMAKAPQAGAVKTRMQPQLTPTQSAELARLMLTQSVERACRHWRGEVVLCVLSNPDDSTFTRLAKQYSLTVIAQRGTDLGARMMHALKHGIADTGAGAVMGCDVPHVPHEILIEAHAMLMRGENPLGAAEDGGFYLIGLGRSGLGRIESQQTDALFGGVNWGGSDELSEVRERAQRIGIEFAELPTLRDIDDYADLEWLAEIDAEYRQFIVTDD